MFLAKRLRPRNELAHKSHGFTLIELLVVMSILASLATILVPIINSGRRMSKIAATKNLLAQIEAAIERFNEQWGIYPPDKLPTNTDLKYFDARGAAAGASAYTTYTNSTSSSQALYYTLCNPYVCAHSPYLELSDKEVETIDASTIPRIVDRWNNPFIYNRRNSLSGVTLPAVFTNKNGTAYDLGPFDDGTDPIHNTNSYDLWSRGPEGYSGTQWITNWK